MELHWLRLGNCCRPVWLLLQRLGRLRLNGLRLLYWLRIRRLRRLRIRRLRWLRLRGVRFFLIG